MGGPHSKRTDSGGETDLPRSRVDLGQNLSVLPQNQLLDPEVSLGGGGGGGAVSACAPSPDLCPHPPHQCERNTAVGCRDNAPPPLALARLKRLLASLQQSLLRQQERVEERVQEIEEQLCKLDSDKCVVEVGPGPGTGPAGSEPADECVCGGTGPGV